ncbi:MAG TPA: 5'-methylthioadenosine/S-adenosylhomocysteine nucleosidase [Mycobacterium sp.]|nr:5'-methylthioadenosine/S-adenosylhomocysteine nucleosidase [Mycobacterium sp.]
MPSQARARGAGRTAVLTAFPAEADAVLARTSLDEDPVVVVNGRRHYLGMLGGRDVAIVMTGIGMANASEATAAMIADLRPRAMLFVGVAGGFGRTLIGDVAIPARWSADGGATWLPVDDDMLTTATNLSVGLADDGLGRQPGLHVGGEGHSGDNNGGAAFPNIPFGGAVFGPQPLSAPDYSPLRTGNFLRAIGPFLIRGVVANVTGFFRAAAPSVDAVDQETAAALQVARVHGVPFLGIRGMSDGPGDPRNLPGFPFTFFAYKRIAAENAAAVAEAFLRTRGDQGRPG